MTPKDLYHQSEYVDRDTMLNVIECRLSDLDSETLQDIYDRLHIGNLRLDDFFEADYADLLSQRIDARHGL